MTFRWRAALAVSMALAPATSWAQAVQSDSATATIERGRLGGSATFSNDLGAGTFVLDDNSDDPYFAQSLRLVPTYGLYKDVSAQADGRFIFEYTNPSDASAGPSGRHWALDDIVLRLIHASLVRDQALTGINVSGAFSAAVPLSHDSRWRNYVTWLRTTVGLDRTFIDRLTVTYYFAVTKYFPTSNVSGDTDNDVCSPGDCNARGPVNPNVALRNQVGATYRFTDRFSTSLLLRFTSVVKFKIGDESQDEQIAEADNRHTYTITLGDISGTYRFTDRYSASAGISSEQYASDSRGNPRFPFFDFKTTRENYTTFYVSGTATF